MSRINTGTMTVGIFAVLFGLVGAYALRAALVREAPAPRELPKSVNVPLASYDIPAGRRVTIGDMALMPMTQEDMLKRKLPLETLMINSDQVLGRIIRGPIKQGEPFLTTNIYPEGTGPDLSERVPHGLRAFTLPIDDVSSVGGSVKVGSFVDVVFRATAQPADRASRRPAIPQTTVTLLENIEVIDVARNEPIANASAPTQTDVRQSNKPGDKIGVRSVTLAVTLEQANMLKTAMGRGEFVLALRGQADPDLKTMNQMTLEQLLGIKEPTPPFTTEVYRGGRRHMIQFDANGHVLEEGYGGWGNTNYSLPQVGNSWGYGLGTSNKKDKDEDETKAKDEETQFRSTMITPGMMRAYSPLYPMMPQYLPAAMPAAGYIPAF